MSRTTKQQQESVESSKKRKNSPNPEPKRKISKTKKNSDGEELVEFSSYSSRIFNVDVQNLLSNTVSTSQSDIFFNHRTLRDEMIKHILKTYEESLMNETRFGSVVTTHAKMHIKGGFQFKRNQCRVVSEPHITEMYMCVRSDEFHGEVDNDDTGRFECDGWLIYRCELMKGPNAEYTTFQTKSTMKGNRSDTKSFHWLGIQGSFCTIRKLDCTVNEVRDEPKGNVTKDEVSIDTIREELRKSLWSPVLSMISTKMASENGIPPICNLESLVATETTTATEPTQAVKVDTETSHINIVEKIPVECPKDMIWAQEEDNKNSKPFNYKRGFDGNALFQMILDRHGVVLKYPANEESTNLGSPTSDDSLFSRIEDLMEFGIDTLNL